MQRLVLGALSGCLAGSLVRAISCLAPSGVKPLAPGVNRKADRSGLALEEEE